MVPTRYIRLEVSMILFQSDWAKHKAVPHYRTTNKTWVKLAGVFHKMGVENSLFHLALHNPELADVDPHAENLTNVEIAMIIDECTNNPWYVLREIIRVPPVAGLENMPLRGNRGNISLYWLFFNHITTMLIQPRQTGKSVSTDSLMVSLLTILAVNTDISLLTKDDALRVKNISRIKGILATLPDYLQLRIRGDANNTEKITISRLGNVYNTAVAQASVKAALKLGRGMTNAINHIDEIAFINNIGTTLPSLLAAAGAARDAAKEAGAFYGNIFTTTPGYLASESGQYAYKVYNECFRWSEKLFDCKDGDDLRDTIKMNSPANKVQVLLDYNHRQLGYTDDWLREKIADAMADGESAEADFLGIWPEGSGSSLISKEKMSIIIDSKRNESDLMVSTHGYIIRTYVPMEDLHKYLIVAGLDTSEAIGKDGIGLVLRDVTTGAVLGTGDFNETNTITFAKWLADLLMEYPNITMVIERKNTGVSIIDAMIEILLHNNVDPFKRLFNWVVNDSRVKQNYKRDVIDVPLNKRSPDVYIKYRKYFGYTTTGSGRSSRDMLYGEIFNTSITYTSDTVRDTKLINQLSGLMVRNNRIDHAHGGNDDMVIGWLLGYWLLSKAENLEYYGLPIHKVLTNVTESKIMEAGGQEAIDSKEYQMELKREIDDLIDRIKNTNSKTKQRMLVTKLKYLYRDIDTNIIQSFNIDSLIDSLNLDKAKKKPYYYYK